jgi:hypothetical protein
MANGMTGRGAFMVESRSAALQRIIHGRCALLCRETPALRTIPMTLDYCRAREAGGRLRRGKRTAALSHRYDFSTPVAEAQQSLDRA